MVDVNLIIGWLWHWEDPRGKSIVGGPIYPIYDQHRLDYEWERKSKYLKKIPQNKNKLKLINLNQSSIFHDFKSIWMRKTVTPPPRLSSLRRVQCNGAGYRKGVTRNLLSSKMPEKSNCGWRSLPACYWKYVTIGKYLQKH